MNRGWLIDTDIVSEWIKPRPDAGMVRWLDEVDEATAQNPGTPSAAPAPGSSAVEGSRNLLARHRWQIEGQKRIVDHSDFIAP